MQNIHELHFLKRIRKIYIHKYFYLWSRGTNIKFLKSSAVQLILLNYTLKNTFLWPFQIPFAKDCGNKEKCISDLTLGVSTTEKDLLIVKSQNDKFNVSLTVRNKRDSAYNTRTIVQYSPNLIFSGIEVNLQFFTYFFS